MVGAKGGAKFNIAAGPNGEVHLVPVRAGSVPPVPTGHTIKELPTCTLSVVADKKQRSINLVKAVFMRLRSMASVTSLFVIGGHDFDPSLFSEQVGISPTKVWRRTLEALKSRHDIPELEWQYQLDRRPHDSLDEAIREVLGPFVAYREQIVNFIHKYNCSASVIFRIYGCSSLIELCAAPDTVVLLASLRCGLCFSVDE